MKRHLLALAVVATVLLPTAPAWAGTARTLFCTGNAGPAYTQRTVTATITAAHKVRGIVVRDQTGAVASRRTTAGASLGASDIHSGYVAWDVTGTNPEADLYQLHLPPVLPGRGGFTDADLVIQWAGGANGSLQIPMFDCRISGGTWAQAHPAGLRHFVCTTTPGELGTNYRVKGTLGSASRPRNTVVSNDLGAKVHRATRAGRLGASVLHTGYTTWNLTAANPDHNRYRLHVAPILPPRGGYFDADLEVLLNGGADGSLQLLAFDCSVS